jgi:MYXO-CTERM domain-containing protein
MKKLTTILTAFALCCFLTFTSSEPVVAQDNTNTAQRDNDDDDADYGWIGLIGLAGLLGLRRRDRRDDRDVRSTTPRV